MFNPNLIFSLYSAVMFVDNFMHNFQCFIRGESYSNIWLHILLPRLYYSMWYLHQNTICQAGSPQIMQEQNIQCSNHKNVTIHAGNFYIQFGLNKYHEVKFMKKQQKTQAKFWSKFNLYSLNSLNGFVTIFLGFKNQLLCLDL